MKKIMFALFFSLSLFALDSKDFLNESLNTAEDYCHPIFRCVPNCEWRRDDGRCLRYGKDFCGQNAACAENCLSRRDDGRCLKFDADICREAI